MRANDDVVSQSSLNGIWSDLYHTLSAGEHMHPCLRLLSGIVIFNTPPRSLLSVPHVLQHLMSPQTVPTQYPYRI